MAVEPQDRKKKKPSVKEVEGGRRVTFPDILARTADGRTIEKDGNTLPLSVTVLAVALDDFELLDDMRAIDVNKNASRLPAMLRRLVGDEYDSVMAALRDGESGRVTITAASAWINDLLGALNPNS